MAFRAKSAARLRAELARQARRYRSFTFEAVDNILDMRLIKELFPQLIEDDTGYEFFFEVKANLTRAQLRLLAQAGVRDIQPGLESLSTAVLRLMDKGVRAGQNVNVLRWARYYGIHPEWNILWGFPGESERDYAEQAAMIPHLVHLPPPSSAGRIWMERFSPMFSRPDLFPVRFRRPEVSYRYVYPAHVDLNRLAYFFDYEPAETLPDRVYADLDQAAATWARTWREGRRPELKYWSAPGFLQIYDARHEGQEGTYTFRGTRAAVYLACVDRPITAAAVHDRLALDTSVAAVEEALDEFHDHGLVFRDGPFALALALPASPGR